MHDMSCSRLAASLLKHQQHALGSSAHYTCSSSAIARQHNAAARAARRLTDWALPGVTQLASCTSKLTDGSNGWLPLPLAILHLQGCRLPHHLRVAGAHLTAGYSTISFLKAEELNSLMSCQAARYFFSTGRLVPRASYRARMRLWSAAAGQHSRPIHIRSAAQPYSE